MSPETLRRRRACVKANITTQLGDDGENYVVLEYVRRQGKEEREKLLREMGLGGEMDEKDGLAMLVDLGMTYNLFRKLRK